MMTIFTDGVTITLVCHPLLLGSLRAATQPEPPQVGADLAVVGDPNDPLNRLESELAAASAQNAIDAAVATVNSRAAALLEQFQPAGTDAYQLTLDRDDAALLGSWCNAQYVRLRTAEFDTAGRHVTRGPASLADELAEILGESSQPEMQEETAMWATLSQCLSGAAL